MDTNLAMALAYGIGALNALGRNPSASSEIQKLMILAIAFAEALAIFALVIALIIKFGGAQ